MQSGQLTIRPWRHSDFGLLAAATGFSRRTLDLRFWGSVPTVPKSYLRRSEDRWPQWWDGVVAVRGVNLLGWAEYGRYPTDPDTADVAACVLDAKQGHGLGTELLTTVVRRAQQHGVVRLHVDIAPYNHAARRAWQSVSGGHASTLALAG